MNLGWKLAATIRGDAPDGLLDTYSSERHPVGAQVLDWSRAQVAVMRPSRSSRALAAIIRDLIDTRDGATYFAERVWGVSLHYDLGGGHPLVGRAFRTSHWLTERRSASTSRQVEACCWTLTLVRPFMDLRAIGATGSRMSPVTPTIGLA